MGESESLSFHGLTEWHHIERPHRAELPTPAAGTAEYQLLEMEKENHRLQKLVAELLMKNQQLRDGMLTNPCTGHRK
jgi:hypothetical protein